MGDICSIRGNKAALLPEVDISLISLLFSWLQSAACTPHMHTSKQNNTIFFYRENRILFQLLPLTANQEPIVGNISSWLRTNIANTKKKRYEVVISNAFSTSERKKQNLFLIFFNKNWSINKSTYWFSAALITSKVTFAPEVPFRRPEFCYFCLFVCCLIGLLWIFF